MSLEAIAQHYVRHYRRKAREELDWFRSQPSFDDAIRVAAQEEDRAGRRYSHQRRIRQVAIGHARERLLKAASVLASQPNFARLHQQIERILEPVARLGELYKYDTALRLGAFLDRLPEAVYLHAGARTGARALGVEKGARRLLRHELPTEWKQLEAHEIEDVLCIYKAILADAVAGRPVHLPDDDRCYLDDPEDAD